MNYFRPLLKMSSMVRTLKNTIDKRSYINRVIKTVKSITTQFLTKSVIVKEEVTHNKMLKT